MFLQCVAATGAHRTQFDSPAMTFVPKKPRMFGTRILGSWKARMGTFPVKCRHHASMASLPVRAPLTASLVRNGSIRDPIGISSRLGNSFNSRRRPPATTCFGTQATPAALVPNSLETSAGSEYQTRGAAFRSQADDPSHTTYPNRIAETAILLLFREYGRRGSESNRRPRLCSPSRSFMIQSVRYHRQRFYGSCQGQGDALRVEIGLVRIERPSRTGDAPGDDNQGGSGR